MAWLITGFIYQVTAWSPFTERYSGYYFLLREVQHGQGCAMERLLHNFGLVLSVLSISACTTHIEDTRQHWKWIYFSFHHFVCVSCIIIPTSGMKVLHLVFIFSFNQLIAEQCAERFPERGQKEIAWPFCSPLNVPWGLNKYNLSQTKNSSPPLTYACTLQLKG